MDVNSSVLHGNSTNDTFRAIDYVFPSYISTVTTILCSLIMGIGVFGNVMVLIVIFKSKDMRSSTNIFLMNLSLADLMVLLICTPTVLVEVNSKPETWILGEEMCKAVPFIETTVAHASVLTILAISFERYYAICEPLKAGYICTKARAVFICIFAWMLAALLASPLLVLPSYETAQYNDGSVVWVCLTPVTSFWNQLFFYLSISLFFWVPFIMLLILYSVIAFRLMSDPGIKGNETFNHRARSQLVIMLGTIVLLFFLCLMPFRVFTLWFIATPSAEIKALGVETYYNMLYFCRCMFYVNSAVNPILYNLMSSKFREGFMRLCGCRSEQYFLDRRRRWDSMHTTMSLSSSRRGDFDWDRRRTKIIARELPYARRLADFSTLTPSLAPKENQPSSSSSSSPRLSIYRELEADEGKLSEYENIWNETGEEEKSSSSVRYKDSIRRNLMRNNISRKICTESNSELVHVVVENGSECRS